MRFRVGVSLLVAVGLLVGCTKSNPKSCTDGSCTDPSLPFCDLDGALSGEPKTCIAVECTPGTFIACRGDQTIECNSSGADYDLVQCEHGCAIESGGCKHCDANDQCSNPLPVCSTSTFDCVGCKEDDECGSRVCDIDTGTCVASAEIVYASTTGTLSDPCTLSSPCSLSQAIMLAASNPARSTVRALPGDHAHSIVVSSGTIKIVATGATITSDLANGHQFLRGSNVTIRGGRFNLASGGIYCGWGRIDTSALGGTLRLRALTIVPANQNTLQTQGCVLNASEVTIQALDAQMPVIRNDSELTFDRCTFANPLGDYVLMMGARVNLSITNSVLDNVAIEFDPRDQTGSTSRAIFAFNTIVRSGKLGIHRTDPAASGFTGTFLTFVENNVVVVGAVEPLADAIMCTGCSVSNNVVNMQVASLPASNIIADPKLKGPTSHDFHLAVGSPAIDAATPSAGVTTDHDFEGTRRPQGTKLDIGAFERTP